jgi:hypothetical protein
MLEGREALPPDSPHDNNAARDGWLNGEFWSDDR